MACSHWLGRPLGMAASLVLILGELSCVASVAAGTNFDVLIVGAGAGGLQWGLILNNTDVSYVILEQEASVGSFFRRYPRGRKLISHNKCNVGPGRSEDFALRHDWHTLLGAKQRMCDFSSEYYPHADTLVDYLSMIASGLNVQYNAKVMFHEWDPALDRHVVRTVSAGEFSSRHVVFATGLRPVPKPVEWSSMPGSGHSAYSYEDFPDLNESPEFCQNQYVGVVGAGNSAFEVADLLKHCAASVTLFSKRPRLASLSHYPGGVRLQYFGIIDRYLLKSMDAHVALPRMDEVLNASILNRMRSDISKIDRDMATETPDETRRVLYTWLIDQVREEFKTNVTIFCGGFTGQQGRLVDDMDPRTKHKFPRVSPFFGAVGVPNAWYAGALMHGTDFKRSSGGFIHGFRYLVRAQARYVLMRDYHRPWEGGGERSRSEAVEWAVSRVQNASGLWQMQDELVDILIPTDTKSVVYLEEVPRRWVTALLRVMRPTSAARARCELRFAYGDLAPQGGGYMAPPMSEHEGQRGLEGWMSEEAGVQEFVDGLRAARAKVRHHRKQGGDTCAPSEHGGDDLGDTGAPSGGSGPEEALGDAADGQDEAVLPVEKVKESWPFELIFEDSITNRLPALFLHPIVEFVRGKERRELGQLREDVHAEWTRKHLVDAVSAEVAACLEAAAA